MVESISTVSDVLLSSGHIIKDRWEIINKIGGGGFGEIFSAIDIITKNKVAIKLERADQAKLVLKMEVAVLKKLQGTDHVCKFYGCGKNESFNYIVMSLQGKNLTEVRKSLRRGVFTISTAVRLGKQLLNCLRDIHEIGFLHRDIKPSNFAMGRLPSTYRTVFMLDFGLSRQYINEDGSIRTPRTSAGFRGTIKYASYNAHLSKELGRHDDLFSLIYMLIEMVSGQLPWRKIKDKEEVGILKQTIDPSLLLQYMPHEFIEIFYYIQDLNYFDKPDYVKIDKILDSIMERRKIKFIDPLDWENAIILEQNVSNENSVKYQSKELVKVKERTFNEISFCNNVSKLCLDLSLKNVSIKSTRNESINTNQSNLNSLSKVLNQRHYKRKYLKRQRCLIKKRIN